MIGGWTMGNEQWATGNETFMLFKHTDTNHIPTVGCPTVWVSGPGFRWVAWASLLTTLCSRLVPNWDNLAGD